MSQQTKRFY